MKRTRRALTLRRDGARLRRLAVYTPPEAAALVPGELERSAGETDERYAHRKKVFDELMAIPDED